MQEMTTATGDPVSDPGAAIDSCLTDLSVNMPADRVLPRLRDLEPLVAGEPRLRARLLRARAVATNRLGFGSEALGDLHEARRLLEGSDDAGELARIFLTIATVFIWRGEGREAALALLRAVAEGDVSGERTSTALALIEAGRLQIENGRALDGHAIIARALEIGGDGLTHRDFQRA